MSKTAAPLLVSFLVTGTGCGDSDPFGGSGTTQATTATTATTTTVAKPAEPLGRLSAGEYKALLAIARIGDRLDKEKSRAKVLRGLRSACAEFEAAPNTELMVVERRACRRYVRFFKAAGAFRTSEAKRCLRDLNAGDVSCIAGMYSRLARSTNSGLASARESNSALRKRGLKGSCADAVGSETAANLRAIAETGRQARIASQALFAHRDRDRYLTADARMNAAFARISDDSKASEVAKLRACRHD